MTEIIGVALLLFCLFVGGLGALLVGYLRERQRANDLQETVAELQEENAALRRETRGS